MIFQILEDIADAVASLPPDHAKRRTLELFEEALRRDVQFIDRHPTTLFQCMWNTCWWYDCPDAAAHYQQRDELHGKCSAKDVLESTLHTAMEHWRGQRESRTAVLPWLRSLRPPTLSLGSGQRAVLRGHSARVSSLAFSNNGQWLASGSQDQSIRIWERASGKLVAEFTGHDKTVYSLGFTRDDCRLIAGSGCIHTWDVRSGTEVEAPDRLFTWMPCVVRWGGDENVGPAITATVANMKDVWVRGSHDGALVDLHLSGHTGRVWTLDWSADGSLLVSGGSDGTVRVWEMPSGRSRRVLTGHSGPVRIVRFFHNGRNVASVPDDGPIRVWNVEDGEALTLEGHTSQIRCISVSGDGNRLVSGDDDGVVKMWDTSGGQCISTRLDHTGAVRSIAFSNAGSLFASGSDDCTVRVWNAKDGSKMATLAPEPIKKRSPYGGIIPDGKQETRGHQFAVHKVSFSEDETRVFSYSHDCDIAWELAQKQISTYLPNSAIGVKRRAVTLLAPGWIAFEMDDLTTRVWDLERQRELFVDERRLRSEMAISDDRRYLALSTIQPQTSSIWDLERNSHVCTLDGHTGWVTGFAFSPGDGRLVATSSTDGTVRLWETSTGNPLHVFEGHLGCVNTVAFSPSGDTIASAGEDTTVRLWSASDGQQVAKLTGHNRAVTSLAFSRDGHWLASGSEDRTVRLWLSNAEGDAQPSQGHSSEISTLAFSPDGHSLATGSEDGAIQLWEGTAFRPTTRVHVEGSVRAVTFAEGNDLVIAEARTTGETELYTWNMRGDSVFELAPSYTEKESPTIAVSPDGTLVAVGAWDCSIRLHDPVTGDERMTLLGHEARLTSVAFSSDGTQLVTSSEDNTVRAWDVRTGQSEVRITIDEQVTCADFSSDGKILAVGSPTRVRLWDWANLREVGELPSLAYSVAFLPGNRLLVRGAPRQRPSRVIRRLSTREASDDLVRGAQRQQHSPSTREHAMPVHIWNLESSTCERRIGEDAGTMYSVAVSPDGRRIATGGRDGTVRIWDVETGNETARYDAHEYATLSVAFSPDGTRLASGGRDGVVRVWDLDDASAPGTVVAKTARARSVGFVAFTPDGRALLIGQHRMRVAIIDLRANETTTELRWTDEQLRPASFAPNGRRIAYTVLDHYLVSRRNRQYHEFSDARDLADEAEARAEPLAYLPGKHDGDLSVDQDGRPRIPVAWWPTSGLFAITHPTKNIWAGNSGKDLSVAQLEEGEE